MTLGLDTRRFEEELDELVRVLQALEEPPSALLDDFVACALKSCTELSGLELDPGAAPVADHAELELEFPKCLRELVAALRARQAPLNVPV